MLGSTIGRVYKSKAAEDFEVVDYKEGKIGNGQRRSVGINLACDSIEDVYNKCPAHLYSRKNRHNSLKPGLEESEVKGEARDHSQKTRSGSADRKPMSKKIELYQKWAKSGLKELAEMPQYSLIVPDEQLHQGGDMNELDRCQQHFKFVAKTFKEKMKDFSMKHENIDLADRENITETADAFIDDLQSYLFEKQEELFKLNNSSAPMHENPLNVIQKDRKIVISHVDALVTDIERSVSEASQSILSEINKSLGNKLEEATRNLKTIEDCRGLKELFDQRSLKERHTFSQEFDPILEGSLHNERGMYELFKELYQIDKTLQVAEEKLLKMMGNSFLSTLETSSIEIVSNFLTPN